MRENKTLASFEFLRRMSRSQELFSLEDLASNSGWTEGNAQTNISKRLSNVILTEGDQYRVDPGILRVPYDRYAALFKQKRDLFVKYSDTRNPGVTVYEFFLPLTLEHVLRQALDLLFYKDAVADRLTSIGLAEVAKVFPRTPTESDAAFLDRVCEFVADRFVGYSIGHVDGRFRGKELLTKDEAHEQAKSGKSYIIDETTAIVRFIVPHAITEVKLAGSQLEMPIEQMSIEEEIRRTNWIFRSLFVEAVLEGTTDQDEIWLLEGGNTFQLTRFVAQEGEE